LVSSGGILIFLVFVVAKAGLVDLQNLQASAPQVLLIYQGCFGSAASLLHLAFNHTTSLLEIRSEIARISFTGRVNSLLTNWALSLVLRLLADL